MGWFSQFGEGLISNTKLHGLPSSGAYPLWNSPVHLIPTCVPKTVVGREVLGPLGLDWEACGGSPEQ